MRRSGPSFQNGTTPSVLLVHGAFADASEWSGVISALQRAGIDVCAPANPLRGLAADAAYLAHVVREIDGPVVLAAHAYGGAVIGVAAANAVNVVGLAFVAAYAVDAGESCLDVAGRFPASALGPALRPASFPRGLGPPGVELYLKRDEYGPVFAGDVPAAASSAAAAAQRPIAAAALEERAGAAAWRALPCTYVVATRDRLLDPDAQRFMADRAEAWTVEIDATHAIAASHPDEVAALVAATVEGSQLTPTRSTTKTSVSSGPMTPPAPRLP